MSEPRSPADPAAGDDEHDAWLREALRHAPDAALSAPPLLRDSILSQARAAVEPAPPAAEPARRRASSPSTFAAFWSWLAQPPVAAGFASVMAATLVGVMWWDRPLDEALPPPSAPPAAVVADAGSVTPEASMSAPLPAATEATPARERAAAATAPAARTAPRPTSDSALPGAGRRGDAATPFPGERKDEGVADAASRADKAAGTQADAASVEKPAPERAADEKRSTSAPKAMAMAPPAAPTIAPMPAPMQAPMPAPMPAQARPALGAMGRDGPGPLAPLRAALAADNERKRTIADGQASPPDDALERWLAELDAATAGRWGAVDTGAERSGTIVPLRVDGSGTATLWLDGNTVTLEIRRGGRAAAWRAELAKAAAEHLAGTVPRLPR